MPNPKKKKPDNRAQKSLFSFVDKTKEKKDAPTKSKREAKVDKTVTEKLEKKVTKGKETEI